MQKIKWKLFIVVGMINMLLSLPTSGIADDAGAAAPGQLPASLDEGTVEMVPLMIKASAPVVALSWHMEGNEMKCFSIETKVSALPSDRRKWKRLHSSAPCKDVKDFLEHNRKPLNDEALKDDDGISADPDQSVGRLLFANLVWQVEMYSTGICGVDPKQCSGPDDSTATRLWKLMRKSFEN